MAIYDVASKMRECDKIDPTCIQDELNPHKNTYGIHTRKTCVESE